jgi:hypothetical protein
MIAKLRRISISTQATTFLVCFDPSAPPPNTAPFNDQVHDDKKRERHDAENSEPKRNVGKHIVEHRSPLKSECFLNAGAVELPSSSERRTSRSRRLVGQVSIAHDESTNAGRDICAAAVECRALSAIPKREAITLHTASSEPTTAMLGRSDQVGKPDPGAKFAANLIVQQEASIEVRANSYFAVATDNRAALRLE